MTGDRFRNNWYPFGHSEYFRKNGQNYDDFMRERWVPSLTSDALPHLVDYRPNVEWYGLWVFLLQNLEFTKVTAYLIGSVLLVFWYRNVEERGRLAIARQLAAESETSRTQRPSELPHSLSLGIHSLQQEPTSDGDVALRRSLSLFPRLLARRTLALNQVLGFAFSDDDNLLSVVYETDSKEVNKSDVALDSTKLRLIGLPKGPLTYSFDLHDHGLVTFTQEGVIRVFNPDLALRRDFRLHSAAAPERAAICTSPDGTIHVATSNGFTIQVSTANKGKAEGSYDSAYGARPSRAVLSPFGG